MGGKIYENLMILGVTGAGKSSLINYLFGSKIAETGTGKPKTKKGEFQKIEITSPLKENVALRIFDSWGLEASEAEEWQKIIIEKLIANYNFKDIIHGVIYCISYLNDRIQDFEIDLIKKLLNEGYKIIVAFTQSDDSRYQDKKNIFRDVIFSAIDEKYREKYTIVDICAAPVKKRWQSEVSKKFGKDELLRQMEYDIFDNILSVMKSVMSKWHKDSNDELDKESISLNGKIDRFYTPVYDIGDAFRNIGSFFVKEKRAKELCGMIESSLKNFVNRRFSVIQNTTNEIIDFFINAEGAIYPVVTGKTQKCNMVKVDLSGSDFGSLTNIVASTIAKLIPVLGIFVAVLEKRFLQDELKNILENSINAIKKEIDNCYIEIMALLEKIENERVRYKKGVFGFLYKGFLVSLGKLMKAGSFLKECTEKYLLSNIKLAVKKWYSQKIR